MLSVDINCDLGEGYPNDFVLMDYISSVNVACGYHAGDETTMRATVRKAIEKGLAIGAHPGYADRENFGREPMALSSDGIREIVNTQILLLKMICNEEGGNLTHIKPHGALYNQSAKNREIAAAISDAVRNIDPSLIIYGLSGSVSIEEAQKLGLKTASEVFADRTYRADGSLTPRTEPNAVIDETDAAAKQALQMITDRNVATTDGGTIAINAETICIHGDGKNALEFAKTIHDLLTDRGITISQNRSASTQEDE